jgi:hypothetical protein
MGYEVVNCIVKKQHVNISKEQYGCCCFNTSPDISDQLNVNRILYYGVMTTHAQKQNLFQGFLQY